MKRNINLSFALRKIEVKQFAVMEENYHLEEEESVKFDLSFEASPEMRFIGVLLKIQIFYGDQPFVVLQVLCSYELNENSWKRVFNKRENSLDFPKDFVTHICALTIGSLRGILFAKADGLGINAPILPLIDLSKIIKSDLSIKLIQD